MNRAALVLAGALLLGFRQSDDGDWIARVGGRTIPLDEYVRRYSDFIESSGIRDNLLTRKQILENMINEELLLHFDRSSRLAEDPVFRSELTKARKRTVLAYLKDRDVYANITVSDAEMREAFKRVNEKLAARHLYAATEEEAERLYQLVQIGVDWDFLAVQVFTDSLLRSNGGYLGYFTWGDMDPAFEDAAYSLRVGDISAPVKTAQGYSIIKLEDRVSHPLLTEYQYQKKKSHLDRVLRIRKKKPAEEEYVRRVFNANDVLFDEKEVEEILRLLRTRSGDFESMTTASPTNVCATYNGTSYLRAEVFARIGELSRSQMEKIRTPEMLRGAIRGFFLQDKLLAIARQKGYDTVSVVLATIGKTEKSLFLKYRLQEIAADAPVSDSVLYHYYTAHPDRFSTEPEVNVQEILVAAKSVADSLHAALQSGSDFGALAARFSLRKWSAKNDGVLGLAPLSRFGQLRGVLWEAKENQLIGPIPVGGVYGLFRVLEKKEATPIPFDHIRDRVEETWRFEQQRFLVKDYLEKLRKEVTVEVNERQLRAFKTRELSVADSQSAG